MPKQTNHSHLKLHHNTWVIRYQIPKDCRQFFKRNEIILSTRCKESEIVDALLIRDREVAKIKLAIRDFRKGKIHREPSLVASRDEATEHYDLFDLEIRKARRSGDKERVEDLDRGQDDLTDEFHEELVSKLVPGGWAAVHKIGKETGNPDQYEIIEKHWPKANRQVTEQMQLVRGRGFLSRIDNFMKCRDMTRLEKKYQQEHYSKITSFAEEFPSIEGVTHREVKLWTRELEEQGLASSTINKRLGILNNYWKFLQEEGLAPDGVFPFTAQNIKQFKKHDRQIFSISDARRLIEDETYQTQKYPYLQDFIKLGFLTGCRVKELCELKTDNIITHQNERVINITGDMTKGNTRGIRKIPLTTKIEPIIRSRIEDTKDRFLFHGIRNKHDDRTGHMSKRFSLHKSKLGFAPHIEVAHSFRHTANTILSKQEYNIPKEHREVLLGWSDGTDKSMSTTQYDHFDDSYPMTQRKRDMEQLCREFYFIN